MNEKFLVINSNYQYIGIVKIISEQIIKFSDLQENMVTFELVGYKNDLLKKFQEECKLYNENFTEDSLIKYVKLVVLKKL